MPNALRVFKALSSAGYTSAESLAVGEVVERARTEPSVFDQEEIIDGLCDVQFSEEMAEALTAVLRNCFPSQRFSTHFDRKALKTRLVRSKMAAANAEAFLDAVVPCVLTPHHQEIRQAVQHQPSPGRVVMCDFTFLKKPEMQKQRRAIVVSARSQNYTGRCAVVPVSKLPSQVPNPMHLRFEPGSYPFFHKTEPVWAICDHIYTVSLERLWMVNVNHRAAKTASLTADHLKAVRNLLGTSLGVDGLT